MDVLQATEFLRAKMPKGYRCLVLFTGNLVEIEAAVQVHPPGIAGIKGFRVAPPYDFEPAARAAVDYAHNLLIAQPYTVGPYTVRGYNR